jgi:hypothetical protein
MTNMSANNNYIISSNKSQNSLKFKNSLSKSTSNATPVVRESDITPKKIRDAFSVQQIAPIDAKKNLSKIAVITCFSVDVKRITADHNTWCSFFKIKKINLTINNAPVLEYNESWYNETLLNICTINAVNENASVLVYCATNSGTDFTPLMQRAITDGCRILVIPMGVPEDITQVNRINFVTSNREIMIFTAVGNNRFPLFMATVSGVFGVGATQLNKADPPLPPMVQVATPWSACGPSKFGAIPNYQITPSQYVNEFNISTKITPDFSSVGTNFMFYSSAIDPATKNPLGWVLFEGTSISAALVAGLFGLIDQFKLNLKMGHLRKNDIYDILERIDAGTFFVKATSGFSSREMINETQNIPRFTVSDYLASDIVVGYGTPFLPMFIDYFKFSSKYLSNKYPRELPYLNYNNNTLTATVLSKIYDIPQVRPARFKRTTIGIITAFINYVQIQNQVQDDLLRYSRDFGLPFKKVRFVNLGVAKNINPNLFTHTYRHLTTTVQMIFSINPNADIIVVTAIDTTIRSMASAVAEAIKQKCDIVKINYLNINMSGFPENTLTNKNIQRGLESNLIRSRKTLFICEVGRVLSYPSTSGLVLSVSSTNLSFDQQKMIRTSEVCALEQGVGEAASLTAKPKYQANLKNADVAAFKNKSIPDVCAAGENRFIFYNQGDIIYESGTHISGSIISGMFSLLNQTRINNNMPTITLSDIHKVFERTDVSKYFFDVVSKESLDKLNNKKYSAATGFDVPSGFGVPIIKQWIDDFGKSSV